MHDCRSVLLVLKIQNRKPSMFVLQSQITNPLENITKLLRVIVTSQKYDIIIIL